MPSDSGTADYSGCKLSRSEEFLKMPRFVPAQTTPPDLPAEVLAEVDAAWERAQGLVADELELHFEVSVSGRVRGELRAAAGGELVSRLSASEALALACGDVGLAVPA